MLTRERRAKQHSLERGVVLGFVRGEVRGDALEDARVFARDARVEPFVHRRAVRVRQQTEHFDRDIRARRVFQQKPVD